MSRVPVPIALTIAGSDPSGGAGIQADLKTFHQHQVYGMAALSLLTVQNTVGVSRVEVMPGELVRAQVEALLTDVPPNAVKTGALGSRAVIEALASLRWPVPLVIDPVMVSKHGHRLLAPEAERALCEHLLPLATLLTPNAEEASVLLNRPVRTVAEAERAAVELRSLGPRAVLLKGGHLEGEEAIDVLADASGVLRLQAPRLAHPHTHGTGCSLSAAITARLARGHSLRESVSLAKQWLSRALASPPEVGHGVGPINHFAPPD